MRRRLFRGGRDRCRSDTTRLMIRPTVRHEMPQKSVTANLEVLVASQATSSSKPLVNRDLRRAHGTAATTTPWRRHRTRGASASRYNLTAPTRRCRHEPPSAAPTRTAWPDDDKHCSASAGATAAGQPPLPPTVPSSPNALHTVSSTPRICRHTLVPCTSPLPSPLTC